MTKLCIRCLTLFLLLNICISFKWLMHGQHRAHNLQRTPRNSRRMSRIFASNPSKDSEVSQPRVQNAPGDLFVNNNCVDCDVCRWMCPSVFQRKGVLSIVAKQPQTIEEKILSYAAMISCPVDAIHSKNPNVNLIEKAINLFPLEVDKRIPGVYFMGFHSSETSGATSYLLRSRTNDTTIMIDIPRYSDDLANQIERKFGGIDLCIVTHQDTIDWHDKWKERFPKMERVIQRFDVEQSSRDFEIKLKGFGPWKPCSDVKIIHTPGHTAGSLCILFQGEGEGVLFTGDTIGYNYKRNCLDGFKRYNHGNEIIQEDTIRSLASDSLQFQWILPSHGRLKRFTSLEDKRKSFLEAADQFDRKEEAGESATGMGPFE